MNALPRGAFLAGLGAFVLTWAGLAVYLFVFALPADEARSFTDPEQRLRVRNDIRETNAQILGGAVGGSIFLAGVFFTWRTLTTAREGQITERFTRAIEQLGKDEGVEDRQGSEVRKGVEIRLGGIYALERIARDSARDHGPVMEVITAFIRERSPGNEEMAAETDHRPPTDVQAALTVIGRRLRWFGHGEDLPLDLRATDLRNAFLRDAHLERANLADAHLEWNELAPHQHARHGPGRRPPGAGKLVRHPP